MTKHFETNAARQKRALKARGTRALGGGIPQAFSKTAMRRMQCTEPAGDGVHFRFYFGKFLDRSKYKGNGNPK